MKKIRYKEGRKNIRTRKKQRKKKEENSITKSNQNSQISITKTRYFITLKSQFEDKKKKINTHRQPHPVFFLVDGPFAGETKKAVEMRGQKAQGTEGDGRGGE